MASSSSIISPNFLLSPLETLEESLIDPNDERVDLHDLTEAYNVLAIRIKEILLKADSKQAPAALSLLGQRADVLTKALRRDVMRVIADPCQETSNGMDMDQIQYARNLALLGQQAIRLVSQLFAFPQLHSTMSVEQLRLILNDVLVILSKPSLPTPHSKKTFALLRWTLQAQKLQAKVLSPYKLKIFAVVKQCVQEENVKEQVSVDGLRILAELLRDYARQFIGPACDLLGNVLKSLVATSSNIRTAAAHSLGAFAFAKVNMKLGYDQRQQVSYELSVEVRKFLKQYLEGSSHHPLLFTLLQSACAVTQITQHGEGPPWAAVVLGSFIVLIDLPIFESSALDQIRGLLWSISDHESSIIQRLLPPVWACFVWAFARLPFKESTEAQEFLSQDFRSGVGSLVCNVLLELKKGRDSIERVLKVVEVMFRSTPAKMDAMDIVCQLLGYKASSSDPGILYRQLFDGTILEINMVHLPRITIPRYAVVRELDSQETYTWWKELYKLWTIGVKAMLNDSAPGIPDSILTAWQTLVLADSDSTHTQGHLTPTPRVVAILGDLCTEFGFKTSDVEQEMKQLRLLCKLWRAAQRVFVESSLKAPGDSLLGGVIRREFVISNVRVQGEWLRLCRTVVMYPDTGGQPVPEQRSELDIQTWVAVARRWVTLKGATGDSLVTFMKLIFPERLSTSGEELKLWGMLFTRALAASRTQSNADEAVLGLWKAFVPDDTELPRAFPEQFYALASAFVNPFENNMSKPVLSFIDDLLRALYLPTKHPPFPRQYITMIHKMVKSLPDTLVVPCLSLLCPCLCRWFEDESLEVSEEVYSRNLLPLYQAILERLGNERPNETTLVTLWRLFISPYKRQHVPGEAYDSFEKFWIATYLSRKEFFHLYDPVLRVFLKGLQMTTGGGIAAGLTQSDGSQMTGSIVPETQQSWPLPVTESQALANYAEAFAKGKTDKTQPEEEVVPSSSSPARPSPARAAKSVVASNDVDEEIVPSSSSPVRAPLLSPGIARMHVDKDDNPAPKTALSPGTKRKRRAEEEEIVEASVVIAGDSSSFPPRGNAEGNADPDSGRCMNVCDQAQRQQTPSDLKPTSEDKGKAKARSETTQSRLPRMPVKRRRKTDGGTAGNSWNKGSQLMTPEPSAPPSSGQQGEEDYESWEKIASPRSLAQMSKEREHSVNGDLDVDMADRAPGIEGNGGGAVPDSSSFRPAKRKNAPASKGRTRTGPDRLLQLKQALQALKDDPNTPIEDLVQASDLVKEFGTSVDQKLVREGSETR